MTVELWSDEANVPVVWELTRKPDGPVDVDLDPNGTTWTPMQVDPVRGRNGAPVQPPRWTATVLLCGPDVTPPVGNTQVAADVLARVRCGGQIATDQWIRVRPR